AGRLAGGLCPEAQARVEQGRERGHHPLPYRFHGGERLRDRPRDRLERAQHRSVPRRGNLDLEPDAVPLAVVGDPDHRAGRGPPPRSTRTAVPVPSSATTIPRPSAIRRPRRPAKMARVGTLVRWVGPPRAAANSAPVGKRSSGSGARALEMACLTARATLASAPLVC